MSSLPTKGSPPPRQVYAGFVNVELSNLRGEECGDVDTLVITLFSCLTAGYSLGYSIYII